MPRLALGILRKPLIILFKLTLSISSSSANTDRFKAGLSAINRGKALSFIVNINALNDYVKDEVQDKLKSGGKDVLRVLLSHKVR